MKDLTLEGKVVLINGAASGIGRAAVQAFSAAGATVVAADVNFSSPLDGVETLVADPTDEAAMVEAFAQVWKSHGRLDVLVNAVTALMNAPLTEMTGAQWDQAHAVNGRAAFLASREAVKLMSAGAGGRILFVTTIGSAHPVLNGNAAYSSSKSAVNMLMKSVALDYTAAGITANAVLPGAVHTENTRSAHSSGWKPTGPGVDPGRHLAGPLAPEDVVPLLLFLSGPGARFISGQTIAVDGGFQVS